MDEVVEREDFVKSILNNSFGFGLLDVYKKYSVCVALSELFHVPLVLSIDLSSDSDFFRRFFYVTVVLESNNNIDFLEKDKGDEDIFKFDKVTIEQLLKINKELNIFIGVVCSKLSFGVRRIDYSE